MGLFGKRSDEDRAAQMRSDLINTRRQLRRWEDSKDTGKWEAKVYRRMQDAERSLTQRLKEMGK